MVRKISGLVAVIKPALPRRDPKEQKLINEALRKAKIRNQWRELGISGVLI